ncbi:ABC transporter ATP-binding protein [Paenibacillus sp. J31TS4]|uniref:ABC transporter ATP-binding protein n=1 Tax=Paenibacillus sp. J31TS4 TaxID=2807195 RepID=UPI001B206015|nr:ATP-binding cassette domain-containing protein [Paenibacillus sp. J31TS4]GIP39396.1 ABC transporter ATP-binding protein [Paenibacillus sp. J31TS4]
MAILTADNVSFRYPEEQRNALTDVSLTIREGEFVVVCGASGSGKSTLLRLLKQAVRPVGALSGQLLFRGRPLEELNEREAAARIGLVFQNPESQIVMDRVWHELAFAMENLGFEPSLMRRRLAEMAHAFGLEPLLGQSVHALSGGQKQLVNLASVLLLQPDLLLLDEPVAQLDPVAARDLLQLVHRLNRECAMTVLISEHRLEDVSPLADRIVYLKDGRIAYDGTPQEICRRMDEAGDEEAMRSLPSVTRLYLQACRLEGGMSSADEPAPFTVRAGREWLLTRLRPDGEREAGGGAVSAARADEASAPKAREESHPPRDLELEQPGWSVRLPRTDAGSPAPLVECREITYQYERGGQEVLRKLSLAVREGELLAVLGGNGAGKSTLLQLLGGLRKPLRGKLRTQPGLRAGYLPQNPLLLFSGETVREELAEAARNARQPEPGAAVADVLASLGLEGLEERHPYELSGGQQQRAAIASVLLGRPSLLLLDEPTKGLDPLAKEQLAELLEELREQGMTIVLVTHDVEFAARRASRCAMLFEGAIAAEDAPAAFFRDNYFFTTAVGRMTRGLLPGMLTYEEVIGRWAQDGPSF